MEKSFSHEREIYYIKQPCSYYDDHKGTKIFSLNNPKRHEYETFKMKILEKFPPTICFFFATPPICVAIYYYRFDVVVVSCYLLYNISHSTPFCGGPPKNIKKYHAPYKTVSRLTFHQLCDDGLANCLR